MKSLQAAITMVALASVNASAQPVTSEPRTMIDFACIAREERTCGMITAVIYDPMGSGAPPAVVEMGMRTNRPMTNECLIFLIDNPPPACVTTVFDASTVAGMLASAEARSRRRERALCLEIASDPSRCPTAIVSN